MIQEKLKVAVEESIIQAWHTEAPSFVVETLHTGLGDYATSVAFALAKQLRKSPGDVAEELASRLSQQLPGVIDHAEAQNSYVNIFLRHDFLREALLNLDEHTAIPETGKGKTVIVEFSQPNIAKKMHIGHLRTTVLGDALANIHGALGYKVIRWNYLGDWGTQFGKLIAAYKQWGNEGAVRSDPVNELQKLYVKFHDELKIHPELEKRGQEEFKRLEDGDVENVRLWKWFKDESLKEFEKTYRQLGVTFDTDIGESFYEKELKPLIAELREKGVAVTGEGGAVIVPLDDVGLPPALVQKSDGATLYLTRDIANIRYRLQEYHPDRMLYVVGNEQALHFQQLFAIAKKLGWDSAELVHVKYGLVLDESGKKFATREGRVVLLEDVLSKARELARKTVKEKNPALDTSEQERAADMVAVGALKHEMLKDSPTTDITFDWKRMLDFSGSSAPYLQYTYARLQSILRKAGERQAGDTSLLDLPDELALIKYLLDFPLAVVKSGKEYAANPIALYLYGLANAANRYYESTRILDDEQRSRRDARLTIIAAVSSMLSRGLSLLGISVPEQM